jgi:putative transposase
MFNLVDPFTRECLAIRIDRKLNSIAVIDVLSDLFILPGAPGYVRSYNSPEFIARAAREWIAAVGSRTTCIEPGSPRENGYCESFNSKLPDELLNCEIFYSLKETRIVVENWRRHYDEVRPHSSPGYRPPAPSVLLAERGCATPDQLRRAFSRCLKHGHELTIGPDHFVRPGQD